MHKKYMDIAIECSNKSKGGPFGAVIVDENKNIIAKVSNSVTIDNDPTAHAEVNAIRMACKKKKNFKLENCILYSSCEPCPMCLSACYWAGVKEIYYANTRKDAADINFDDNFIYDEIIKEPSDRTIKMEKMENVEAIKTFNIWKYSTSKIEY
jgi:tRNA(Arg) A34 adenosine deaminase TadA